jgi:predicted ATPase/DNA-binding CsgD family transcriptional regulator
LQIGVGPGRIAAVNTSEPGSRPERDGGRRHRPAARMRLTPHKAATDEGAAVGLEHADGVVGPLTPLVGREAELSQAAGLLEHTRLLTITGTGGVGKTRLALELMRRRNENEPRARVFVELAPVERAHDEPAALEPVASAIWRALASTATPGGQPIGAPLDAVVRHFKDRSALLVLDNCEHLPAAGTVTELLLRECSRLRVLATSRRPLGLAGEVLWQLPALSLPAADAIDPLAAALESEAGQLFVQRAQRSLPTFSLTSESAGVVAELCRRLDGLAMAIELAAARVRMLSPGQILGGLSDRARLLSGGPATALSRHQTLTASLQWSYDLIDEDARAMLRLLGVAYDWSLEAIQAAWASDGSPLDALSEILDAGLIVIVDDGGVRKYRLLESIRAFALERLRNAGEEDMARRSHLRHFRALGSGADRMLESDAGRRQLELEARNLLAALEFAAADEPVAALELAVDLRHWLLVAGNPAEARGLCARVLAATPDANPVARAQLLYTAAQLAVYEEDFAATRAYAEQALPLAMASGDDGATGVGLMLASVAKRSVDPRASAQLGQQSVELLRRAGDRHDLALAVAQLAMTEALRDRFDAVRSACDEFTSLTNGQPPSWLAVWLEIALAWADLAQGNLRSSLAHSERGLMLEGARPSLGHYVALSHKIHAMTLVGDAAGASAIGTNALEQAEREGLDVAVAAIESVVDLADVALGDLDAARARVSERLSHGHFAGAANSHELLARLDLAQGHSGALREHAAALRASGSHTGSMRRLAIASWADGVAAILDEEFGDAGNHLQEALAIQIEHGLQPDAIDTLEALAELQIVAGRAEFGARLLGGAQAARQDLELNRLLARESHFARLHECGEDLLGQERWTAALAEGLVKPLDEVLDYARRGRGHRATSRTGLSSLTPTERRVAEAAAEGLTNPAIAGQLFMSQGTVKAHLAHAYKKCGVANRLQLATLVRGHSSPP